MPEVSEQSEASAQLVASLPDWCAVTWRGLIVCSAFVLLFLFFSYLPVSAPTTQHDAWTGGWIVNHGLLAADPSLPLSAGIRQHPTRWLGRVIIHRLAEFGGLELLSLTFALLQTLTIAIWAWLAVQVSGRWYASLLVIAAFAGCSVWLSGLSTATFGQLCLAIVACLLVRLRDETPFDRAEERIEVGLIPSGFHWAALLSMMIFWTNVDASFVIGWGLVALFVVSRFVDLLAKSWVAQPNGATLNTTWRTDRPLRRTLILLEAIVLAALVNPLGWRLHQAFFWWPDQPMWQTLGGWQPLVLTSTSGLLMSLLCVGWIAASRSAARMQTWQWLLPLVGTIWVATNQSALVWVAPWFVLSAVSLLGPSVTASLASIESVSASAPEAQESVPLRFASTLLCGLIVWVGFAISPSSVFVLGGQGRSEAQLLGSRNPTTAVAFLLDQSNNSVDVTDAGLLWCPNYWSDRLQSPDAVTPVFANLNLDALPARAAADYHQIFHGEGQWRKLMDQYHVDRLLIDKQQQGRLMSRLRKQPGGWKCVHEDDVAVVFERGGRS